MRCVCGECFRFMTWEVAADWWGSFLVHGPLIARLQGPLWIGARP